MYCAKCGYKVLKNARQCQNCGASVEGIEYCGGFWGLVNREEDQLKRDYEKTVDFEQKEISVPVEKKEKDILVQSVKMHERKQNNIFLKFICILLVFGILVQSGRVIHLSKELKHQKVLNQEMNGHIQRFRQEEGADNLENDLKSSDEILDSDENDRVSDLNNEDNDVLNSEKERME